MTTGKTSTIVFGVVMILVAIGILISIRNDYSYYPFRAPLAALASVALIITGIIFIIMGIFYVKEINYE